MTSMSDFFTREKANEGIKIPLNLPDGTATDEYLILRGIDSDYYREAEQAIGERFIKASVVAEERIKAAREAQLDVLVSLIADWSFEDECTPENIKRFLIEAPQIANKIDQLSVDRGLFFRGLAE